MKLIYRGITYDYDPIKKATCRLFEQTHTSQIPYELIYRGYKYRVDRNALAKPFVKAVTYKLLYRGTSYLVHRNEQGEVTAIDSISQSFKNNRLQAIFSSLFAN